MFVCVFPAISGVKWTLGGEGRGVNVRNMINHLRGKAVFYIFKEDNYSCFKIMLKYFTLFSNTLPPSCHQSFADKDVFRGRYATGQVTAPIGHNQI